MNRRDWLIDGGAFISLIPPSHAQRLKGPNGQKLTAANGTEIDCYGELNVNVHLGSRSYNHTIMVANVKASLLGADFLATHYLAPNHKDRTLIDLHSLETIDADIIACPTSSGVDSVNHINSPSTHNDSYSELLNQFPQLSTPNFKLAEADHGVSHRIPTTGHPIKSKARKLAPEKLALAKAELEKYVELGVARRSKSEWSSPLLTVQKPDGSLRVCGDYRRLNCMTEDDHYPVRNISDFNSELAGKTIFSKIDLLKGYHQIPVAPDDIRKTAVITPFGLYEFPRTPFGLKTAGQSFQRLMDSILMDIPHVFVYIDDVLVASSSPQEHLEDLTRLFTHLQENGLVINAKKCVFGQPSLDFLGYKVDAQGIHPMEDRVQAIRDQVPPTSIKELQRFLGMINYYRRFIPRAAHHLYPLFEALKDKPKTLNWTTACQSAFEAIKEALSSATLLHHPRHGAPLAVTTDASKLAIGAVLEQRGPTGWEPLAYFSAKLSAAHPNQQDWPPFDRELLGVFRAVRHFRHMLEGRAFTIYTDQQALIPALHKKSDPLTQRQTYQLSCIAEMSTDIRYIQGKSNFVADALSRPNGTDVSSVINQQCHLFVDCILKHSLPIRSLLPSNNQLPLARTSNSDSSSISSILATPHIPRSSHVIDSTPPSDTSHSTGSTPGGATSQFTNSTPRGNTSHFTGSTPGGNTSQFTDSTPRGDTSHSTGSTPGGATSLINNKVTTGSTSNVTTLQHSPHIEAGNLPSSILHRNSSRSSSARVSCINVPPPISHIDRPIGENSRAHLLELIGAVSNFDIDLSLMANEQILDADYRRISTDPESGLSFRKVDVGNKDLIVDVSNGKPRPFVPYSWRRRIFDAVHGLGHPGVHRTQQTISDRFVWPSIKADCTRWARECVPCQTAKVSRHVTPPIGEFQVPSQRFTHLNMDLVTLSNSNGFSHLLTIVDRFTRWPVAIPIANISAETVADAFAHGWVASYGVPIAITTDRGSQFSSSIWTQLMSQWGIRALMTAAYHPEANGLVERLHRRLKEALIALSNEHPQEWYWKLPLALLAIRTTLKPDIGASPADLVFGDALSLPGDVVSPSDPADQQHSQRQAASLASLRVEVARLLPTPTSAHRTPKLYIPGQLESATHVFVRRGGVQPTLSAPYEGPFRVISRTPTGFHVRMSRGRTELITLNRLKPAHVSIDDDPAEDPQDLDDLQPPSPPPPGRRPGVRTRQPAHTTRQTRSATRAQPTPSSSHEPAEQPTPNPPPRSNSRESDPTRSRRGVRNLDEFNVPPVAPHSAPVPLIPPEGSSAEATAPSTSAADPSSVPLPVDETEPTRETGFFAPLDPAPIPSTSKQPASAPAAPAAPAAPTAPAAPPSVLRTTRPASGHRVRFFSDPRPSDPPRAHRPFSASRRPRPDVSAIMAHLFSPELSVDTPISSC